MIKSLFLLLVLLITLSAFTQDEPKVVVFNSSKSTREATDFKNLIKFGMLEPFSGSFSLYYERVLTDKFSAEIGLGLTIKDYLSIAFNDIGNLFSETSDEARLGPSFALGLRYYPSYIPEDFYVAAEFRYKRYLNDRSYNDGVGDLIMTETNSSAIGRITFGYQFKVLENVFWDFYGGFGIGKVKQSTLDIENVYDPATGEYYNVYSTEKYEGLKPKLHIGIKLGIAI